MAENSALEAKLQALQDEIDRQVQTTPNIKRYAAVRLDEMARSLEEPAFTLTKERLSVSIGVDSSRLLRRGGLI